MKKHENFDDNGLVQIDPSDLIYTKLPLKYFDEYFADGGFEDGDDFDNPWWDSITGLDLKFGGYRISTKEDECLDWAFVDYKHWQKATAKAIFELMPKALSIYKIGGKVFVVEIKGNVMQLSIDLFPFSETGEIKREDVCY